jgi:hypothetical protein
MVTIELINTKTKNTKIVATRVPDIFYVNKQYPVSQWFLVNTGMLVDEQNDAYNLSCFFTKLIMWQGSIVSILFLFALNQKKEKALLIAFLILISSMA